MTAYNSSARLVSADELPSPRRINILDLPTDVLNSVFDCFRDECLMSDGSFNWTCFNAPKRGERAALRQNIHNSSLVCRRFNELVSPLLCPILNVQLDAASLDRAEKVSRSPRLAAKVRGVQVVLPYRPRELAEDLSRYKARVQEELRVWYSLCDYTAQLWDLGDHDKDEYLINGRTYRYYEKAIHTFLDICSAWSAAVGEEFRHREKVEVKIKELHEYQRILLEGHAAYQKKHEEQFRFIMDGSFVNRVAALMSRMINANILSFRDEIARTPDPFIDDPTIPMTDMQELLRLIIVPHEWWTIENLERMPELLPAKLLSELPIAIHKAGVKLREINIGCFPLINNHSMICPDLRNPGNPEWSKLHAACQSLSKFNFGTYGNSLNSKPLRSEYLSVNQQDAMDQYLGAMLSGQSLEIVNISFNVFGLEDGIHNNLGSHRIGKMLEAAEPTWPHISKLLISDGTLNQSELEQLCNGLGNSLRRFVCHDMELSSGSWAGALDILRNKVGTRVLEGRCEVLISRLTGGEFGKPEPERGREPRSLWDTEPPILIESVDYISGADIENPLRNRRS